MSYEERKQLRLNILEELYSVYFETGKGKVQEKTRFTDDLETNLAYQYLIEKRLIVEASAGGRNYEYRITDMGIDVIEGSVEIQEV
ncbi:hypothetical protein PP175_13600 [Aneurinibacillus sp. Ricciae_BoGa-3]|uniref:hypothetical protein n=1 Tax=Aneurinibacillus sp. Ricciae_BoGa-3 TaxID=3022697 RepID=UPI00234228C5|nr:hypothetical protein [Aneurinibacillus sp. Ricciae_BoGa-3]WCK52490.1 hypothetical protein PP175_13600 [Aneurinibacillus sp. Ricciae_BoGa-3]